MDKTTNNSEKIVSLSFVETILRKLYDWMPFKRNNGGILQDSKDENGEQTLSTSNENEIALGRYNETDVHTLLSIGIGSRNNRKNALSIKHDGEVFIITDIKNYKVESLQNKLSQLSVDFVDSYNSLNDYLYVENKGKFIYVNDNEDNLKNGLYVIGIDLNNNVTPYIVGSSVNSDLSNYYTKEEIDIIIEQAAIGDVDLSNYYTIYEVDERLGAIRQSIDNINSWIDAPMTQTDINNITNK